MSKANKHSINVRAVEPAELTRISGAVQSMLKKIKLVALIGLLSSSPAFGINYKVIDAHGNTVIPPLYESIQSDGIGHLELTPAADKSSSQVNSHVTVDFNGHKVSVTTNPVRRTCTLPDGYARYDERDGYLLVRGPNGSGVFSPAGEELLPALYEGLTYHGDHIFSATKYDNLGRKIYLFNDQGQIICELPSWAQPGAKRFHEGLLNISNFDSAKFVDKFGNIKSIGDNIYREISDFQDGLAVASYRELDSWYSCYIDTSGKMLLGPFKNCTCGTFTDGVALIERIKDDTTAAAAGLLKRSGKFALSIGSYDLIRPISNNFWFATKGDSRCLLRHDGAILCEFPPGCTQISSPAKLTQTAWFPCEFKIGDDKSEQPKPLWGYCDISGRMRIQPKFAACGQFENELAIARLDKNGEEMWGVIDRHGNWVIQPAYKYLQIVSPNRFIVSAPSSEEAKASFKTASSEDRHKIFCQFLKDFDLIGMSKEELESNLGKPDAEGALDSPEAGVISYSLRSGFPCGNAYSGLEFRIDQNNKVTGWRQVESMAPRGKYFITENVRQELIDGPLTLGNLIPKNDATTPSAAIPTDTQRK